MLKEKVPIINKHMHMLPTVYLEQFSQGRGLLVNSLEKTSSETQERFLYEMIYLANKVLMADFKPLNNSNEIKHSMEKASSLATLGPSIAMKEKGRRQRRSSTRSMPRPFSRWGSTWFMSNSTGSGLFLTK